MILPSPKPSSSTRHVSSTTAAGGLWSEHGVTPRAGAVLRHVFLVHAKETALGIALALAVTPAVLVLCAEFNAFVDAAEDPYVTTEDAIALGAPTRRFFWPRVMSNMWMYSNMPLGLFVYASNLPEVSPARTRQLARELVLCVAAAWASILGVYAVVGLRIFEPELALLPTVGTGTMSVVATWRASCAAPEAPGFFRALLVWVFMSQLVILTAASMLPSIFDPALDDSARLLLLVVLLPLFSDGLNAPVRAIAYRFPGRNVEWPLAAAWPNGVSINLWSRAVLLSFRTTAGLGQGIVLVGLIDAALRRTARARDRLWARNLRDRPHARHARYVIRSIDEVTDAFAVVLLQVMAAAFRSGQDRVAPDVTEGLASAALQLSIELCADTVIAVLLLLAGTPAQVRGLFRRLGARRWPRRYVWFVLVWIGGASVYYVALIFQPIADNNAVLCPWSKSGGWWHFVPCESVEEWRG